MFRNSHPVPGYQKTLERYAEEFGEKAPADIWPISELRFANQKFRRLDACSYFILRKRTVAGAVGIAGGALLLAGCATQLAAIPAEMFCVGFVILVVVVTIAKAFGVGGKRGGGGCGGGGCGAGNSGCGGGGCGGGD